MCQSNCSDPIPQAPLGHKIFCGFLIILFLPYPALINHFNNFIFQCLSLFITPIFSITPGQPLSEQFDRRIKLE